MPRIGMSMRRIAALLLVALALSACSQAPAAQEGATGQQAASPLIEALDELSANMRPVRMSGDGDSVLDVPYPGRPMAYRFVYAGNGFFSADALDQSGNTVGPLVTSVGPYEGTVMEWSDYEDVAALEVKSYGDWSCEVIPLNQLDRISNGQTLNGDNVVIVDTPSVSRVSFDYTGDGFFSADAIGIEESSYLVTHMGPYQGTSSFNDAPFMLIVTANGDWTVSWQ